MAEDSVNRTHLRAAYFARSRLTAKMFAYANAVFAYAGAAFEYATLPQVAGLGLFGEFQRQECPRQSQERGIGAGKTQGLMVRILFSGYRLGKSRLFCHDKRSARGLLLREHPQKPKPAHFPR